MITVLSPCWRSILLTTTWHVWYTDEHVVTLLTEYTIFLPGRHPHIHFHVCVLHLIYSHHSIIIAKYFGRTFSASTIAFSLYHGGFVSWRLQERELLLQQQRQCKSLVRMRKGVSQQQEHVNGVNANQRSDKVKNGRPIWRGMQRGVHVWQRSNKVRYGRWIWWGMRRGTHVCQRSDEVKYGRPNGRGMQRGVQVCQRSGEVKHGRPIRRGMQRGAHVCQRRNMQRMVCIISIYYCWIISVLILYLLSLIMLQDK